MKKAGRVLITVGDGYGRKGGKVLRGACKKAQLQGGTQKRGAGLNPKRSKMKTRPQRTSSGEKKGTAQSKKKKKNKQEGTLSQGGVGGERQKIRSEGGKAGGGG